MSNSKQHRGVNSYRYRYWEHPKNERVQKLPVSQLKPFEEQPFKVLLDKSMDELAESIKESGVLSPIIARPHKDGGYEILSGHRRVKACEMAGMLDNIMNRVIANRHQGRYTHIYIDEAHLFFANQFSSEFLARAWKRFRKYGGLITGITQNVTECLASPTAKLMLSNSEFVIMLNQSPPDRNELAPLMNISPTQISYIDNAPSGQGIMRVGPNIIPFVNLFPSNTQLYKLMTTKPSESQI